MVPKKIMFKRGIEIIRGFGQKIVSMSELKIALRDIGFSTKF